MTTGGAAYGRSGNERGDGVESIDARIERLLNQLEDPKLTDVEIARIERKLRVLNHLQEQEP